MHREPSVQIAAPGLADNDATTSWPTGTSGTAHSRRVRSTRPRSRRSPPANPGATHGQRARRGWLWVSGQCLGGLQLVIEHFASRSGMTINSSSESQASRRAQKRSLTCRRAESGFKYSSQLLVTGEQEANRGGSRAYPRTAGDCPNFAESAEQNGTVPFSEAVLE